MSVNILSNHGKKEKKRPFTQIFVRHATAKNDQNGDKSSFGKAQPKMKKCHLNSTNFFSAYLFTIKS